MNTTIKLQNYNRLIKTVAVFLCILFFESCSVSKVSQEAPYALNFLDEYILEDQLKIGKHEVGGLSGIDYDGKHFVLISDHSKNPVIYKIDISIEDQNVKDIQFLEAKILKCDSIKSFDTESIRFLAPEHQYLITTEGNINNDDDPFILKADADGKCTKTFSLPKYFKANAEGGPRHNGVFEGLTLDKEKTGFWIINELPLRRDGKKPKLINTNSPLRLTHYQLDSSTPDIQLSYDLDRLIKFPLLPFGLNGATEILQIDNKHLLVLERAYSAGHKSKGNRIKIFLVDISGQQNLLNVSTLKDHKKQNLNKKLLFDSKLMRKQLSYKFIDNIEGMSFGPDLNNGNKSLILVSDNNFNVFGNQINQFLLLELCKP